MYRTNVSIYERCDQIQYFSSHSRKWPGVHNIQHNPQRLQHCFILLCIWGPNGAIYNHMYSLLWMLQVVFLLPAMDGKDFKNNIHKTHKDLLGDVGMINEIDNGPWPYRF